MKVHSTDGATALYEDLYFRPVQACWGTALELRLEGYRAVKRSNIEIVVDFAHPSTVNGLLSSNIRVAIPVESAFEAKCIAKLIEIRFK